MDRICWYHAIKMSLNNLSETRPLGSSGRTISKCKAYWPPLCKDEECFSNIFSCPHILTYFNWMNDGLLLTFNTLVNNPLYTPYLWCLCANWNSWELIKVTGACSGHFWTTAFSFLFFQLYWGIVDKNCVYWRCTKLLDIHIHYETSIRI